MDDNRKKALAAALTQIEKQFGKGSVMRMGDGGAVRNVDVVSTGSLGLDLALGIGGLPRGRVVEIYGPESSGKTTLTLHVVAEIQKLGGTAAFVDAEHALDAGYAQKLGVNIEELLVSQPDTGEQALEITDMLVRSGAVDIVVVDSVAALTPKAEIEGEMGDSHMGLQARLMSQALRKLTGNINRSNCLVIFINQIRMKIGVMFGSPETTTGGNALKFYASVRLDIRRTGSIKKGDEVIGNETKVKVVKNKVAPPFREAEFDILYGEGISREGEIVTLGVAAGIIDKSGAWYAYQGNRIGQGKDNARIFLRDNPDLARTIEARIREQLLPRPADDAPVPDPADPIDPAELRTLSAPACTMTDTGCEPEPDRAVQIERLALKLLAVREHSRLELERKLAARGHDRAAIAPVLDGLAARGALDEVRLVEVYAAERIRKGFGPLRIRAQLRDKGLSDEAIDRHLTTLNEVWPDLLTRVHDRRFGAAPPAGPADYGRRGRFLEGRGFPSELIHRLLHRHD